MRALVQRVESASVSAGGAESGRIGPGLVVLLGVRKGDDAEQAARLARKLLALRVFDDDQGRMNMPLGDRQVLCVSQFTLYADTSQGNRPGFAEAAGAGEAEPLYEAFCEQTGAERGVFGAHMRVDLVADGPVTVMLEA